MLMNMTHLQWKKTNENTFWTAVTFNLSDTTFMTRLKFKEYIQQGHENYIWKQAVCQVVNPKVNE